MQWCAIGSSNNRCTDAPLSRCMLFWAIYRAPPAKKWAINRAAPPLGGGGGIHTAYKPPMCGYQPTHHGWMLFVVWVVMRWDWRDACSKTQKDTFNTLSLVPYNEVKIIFDSGINLQVLAALTLTWRYNQLKVFLLPGCWQTTCCPWQYFQAYLLLASVCP